MRIRRIAPDVWVGISAAWQTTMTVYGTRGRVVIDGPVAAEDIDAFDDITVSHVIATHGDWDHLLAPLRWPDAIRMADARTVARLRSDGAAIGLELASWDARHGPCRRRLPDWSRARVVAVPGRYDLPAGPVETVATSGHTVDGLAVLLPEPKVLVVGDYVSPCEIPSWDPGGAERYLTTLDTLAGLIPAVHWVVPGHGWPLGITRARSLIDEDRRYVDALLAAGDGPLPRHGGDALQQRQHLRNRSGLG
jgi:glyoxylase-like metal-dependent hydrolase (beta-lactamase superfamily II)